MAKPADALLAVPADLIERPQWVLHRARVPHCASNPSQRASSTDPRTWSSYNAVCEALGVDGVEGIGFVIAPDDPFTGIDIDNCVTDDEIHPHVRVVLEKLDSYAEFSPSGTGVHVWVRARLDSDRCRTSATLWGGNFETYDHGRFFTVTGDHVPGTPLTVNERQAELDQVRAALFSKPSVSGEAEPGPQLGATLTDDEVLRIARGASNGAEFARLFDDGDTSHHNGDDSAADLALCNMLAFYTGPERERIDRLFRSSKLMRPKWDARRGEDTYGERTITKALEKRTDFYNGQKPRAKESGKESSRRASQIRPRRIRWVWRGFLASKYLALQSGESALGKSLQACSTIAKLTHGTLEGHLEDTPARALIVASEDALEDMWVPRLTVAGADLDLIEFQLQTRDWNLRDDLKLTEGILDHWDAKLVLIDSVMEHLPEARGGESINSPTFVRRALGPFADLCKARDIAGLVSTHPPKSKGSSFQDMVMASAAFVHVCRTGMVFAWHPDDLGLEEEDRRRVLIRPAGSSNIGRNPGAFEFRVCVRELVIEGETEEVPYTTQLEPSDVTFLDLTRVSGKEKPSAKPKVAAARALIDERLADGELHRSMIDELIEKGFPKSTAYEAAEHVKKRQINGVWWWAKP